MIDEWRQPSLRSGLRALRCRGNRCFVLVVVASPVSSSFASFTYHDHSLLTHPYQYQDLASAYIRLCISKHQHNMAVSQPELPYPELLADSAFA